MKAKNNNIWPIKYNILGIGISATTYKEMIEVLFQAANDRRSCCVSHLAVHGLVLGSKEKIFQSMLNKFDIVAPDGQPVRYALKYLYKVKLPDRCYGPEFMMRVCKLAENEKIGVYLYGSYPHIVSNLQKNLITRFPKLNVVGWEPSVFRPLTRKEDEDLVERINKSGPGIVFIGLGCPLQEKFAFEHKNKIKAVQICVGAAFDFHSGEKKMAPKWMQRCSLEWLFRFLREPKRLWKRYLVTNTNFLLSLFLQKTGIKKYKSEERFSELRGSGI